MMKRFYPLLLITVVAVVSCMGIKKATDKVLADPAAKEVVGREWEKQNPCNNDTVFRTKRDTTVETETVYIPGAVTVRNDTVYKTDTVINKQKAFIHDTVKAFITDTRRLYLAEDSVRLYKVWLTAERLETARLNAEHGQVGTMLKYAGNALLRKWWFWAILLAAGGLWYISRYTSILSIFNRK